MATERKLPSAASKSAARRRAKLSAQGQRQLPKSTTSRAREAAEFIEPYRGLSNKERDSIIDIKMKDWWDNGKSLDEYRKKGKAEDIYNYASHLVEKGAKEETVNVTYAGGDLFSVYISRSS